MRLKTTLGLVLGVAALAAGPAAQADAQRICVSGTDDTGTICSDQVVPFVEYEAGCVQGAVTAGYPADAVRCVPQTIWLPPIG